ncbi:hypothetical protein FOZ63_003477, partial [Perkinsus olseni]
NDGLDPPRSPKEKAALDAADKLPGARGGKKHHVTEFTAEEKVKYYEVELDAATPFCRVPFGVVWEAGSTLKPRIEIDKGRRDSLLGSHMLVHSMQLDPIGQCTALSNWVGEYLWTPYRACMRLGYAASRGVLGCHPCLILYAMFRSGEAFLCIFPPGPLCRLMLEMEGGLRARKKLIILPGWRFDQNFKQPNDSCNWSNDLHRLFVERKGDGLAALGAISLFDVHHMHHFIGVPVTEIPLIDTCVNPTWLARSNRVSEGDRASKDLVLYFPARKNYPDRFDPNNYIYKRILKPAVGDILMKVRKVYPRFEVEDLVRHKAVVWVPYAPTICALVEQYSAGITIFVPSLTYLVQLVLNATDKKFPTMYHPLVDFCFSSGPGRYDTITGRECYAEGWTAKESGDPYPPGDMFDDERAASFFYTRPFFRYFDSPEDLKGKLQTFTLSEAKENSRRIRHY